MPPVGLSLLARTGILRHLPAVQVRHWLDAASPAPAPEALISAAFQTQDISSQRQLLVDVSVIHAHDAGTGIQRVTRSVLQHLQSNPPQGFNVRCVAAGRKHPYCYISPEGQLTTQKVIANAGDVFLGLDLTAHLLPYHLAQLVQWKLVGTSLHFVVYDMLPLTHPAQFKVARTRHFQRWANTIARVANTLLCISNSVQTELQHWLSHSSGLTPQQIPSRVIPLGGDFYKDTAAASLGQSLSPVPKLSAEVVQTLSDLQHKPWALMVGTLEPRKCHARVLDAFEHLWRQKIPVALVLVGRPGWHTEALQQRITQHLELNRNLYWFSEATDAELALFYQQTTGVVVASLAEGYGLPISEALIYSKPLLARDLPVFREVAGSQANYFTDDNPETFSATLLAWLVAPQHTNPITTPQGTHTWEAAAHHILQALNLVATIGTSRSPLE